MIQLNSPRCTRISTLIVILWLSNPSPSWSQTKQTIVIRGHEQTLHVYGSPRADPVILSSGDGGWIHLAPHVAEFLSQRGFFVIGFDVRAYLASFTTRRSTLRTEDEPGDYQVLAEFATTETGRKPMLIGVSEGAGLSVLAATDPQHESGDRRRDRPRAAGLNELGWRWRDMVIYLTHGDAATSRRSASRRSSIGWRRSRWRPFIPRTMSSCPSRQVDRCSSGAQRAEEACGSSNASDHRFSDNLRRIRSAPPRSDRLGDGQRRRS